MMLPIQRFGLGSVFALVVFGCSESDGPALEADASVELDVASADATTDVSPSDLAAPDNAPGDGEIEPDSAVDATVDARIVDAEPDAAVEVDPARPARPTVCDAVNRGACACNDAPGFTTYTWWVADQQRCMSTYVPSGAAGPLPVVITHDCYSENGLGQCRANSGMVTAADRFGFVGVCTTSADGNWTFGNDGVVNDDNPTPCAEADSKDITYLRGVFDTIDALTDAGTAAAGEVFVWGFSQNAMFSAYTAFCHPDRVKAIWQGGSGLFVAGETDPLPQMEGACRRSDFLEHGRACADVAPCDDCQYFPIYPIATDPPMSACVMAYADDFAFPTAAPMATRMRAEGHNATLLQFPDIGRGHSNPINAWDWMIGCMGVVPSCSPACAEAFAACVSDRNGQTAEARAGHFDACVQRDLAGCSAGCAPTLDMLRLIERPCVVDGRCDGGETPETCAVDCGGDPGGGEDTLPTCEELDRMQQCCGDDVCDGPENGQNCPSDCP